MRCRLLLEEGEDSEGDQEENQGRQAETERDEGDGVPNFATDFLFTQNLVLKKRKKQTKKCGEVA